MQPFAKIVNSNNEQIWGDYKTGRLYVFKLPAKTIVDLTNIDKGPIWPTSKSIKIEQVEKNEITIKKVIDFGKNNNLDWRPIKFYDNTMYFKKVSGPLYPKKILSTSPFGSGRFYEFVKKYYPDTLNQNNDYFKQIGAIRSSDKNKFIRFLVWFIVISALSCATIAVAYRVYSVMF